MAMHVTLLLCVLLASVFVNASDSATLHSASQWLTTHSDISISNSDSTTVNFNLAQWIWGDHGGDTFYVYVKPNQLPPYVNGGHVNLQFDFWQDPANTYYAHEGFDSEPQIKVYAVTNLPSTSSRWYPDPIFYNETCWDDGEGPCEVVFSHVAWNWIPSGESNAIHIDITYWVGLWDAAQFVLEIILDEMPSRAGGNDYYFSNVVWSMDESPNDYSTLSLVDTQKWSSAHEDVVLTNPSSSRLRLKYPQWAWGADQGFTWYYWLHHGALPDLESGTTWTLSFNVFENVNNDYCSTCSGSENAPSTHEILLYVVDDLPVGDDIDFWYPTTIQGSSGSCSTGNAVPYDCTVIDSATVLTGIPSGSSHAASVSFTLPNTVTTSMQILMQINLPGQPSAANFYYFNSIQITKQGGSPPPASASSSPSPAPAPSASPSPSPSAPSEAGVWFNGVNVAWNNFGGDIGGTYGYDSTWFGNMYSSLNSYGSNTVRLWIHAAGNDGLAYSNGYVTGLTSSFLSDLTTAVSQADGSDHVFLLALWSFDMCTSDHTDLITDESKTQSYVDNALRPMAQALVGYNNVLWEVIGEPEYCITESGSTVGGSYPTASLSDMQRFISILTNEIHAQTDHLVTVGSASLKWNSDRTDIYTEGNWYKDSALQYGATLDFYQVHYYSWMKGNGYTYSPADYDTAFWGLDKPTLVGEASGDGDEYYTPLGFAEDCYNNGFIGVLWWSYNWQGTGDQYSWVNAQSALQTMASNHPTISDYSYLVSTMDAQR